MNISATYFFIYNCSVKGKVEATGEQQIDFLSSSETEKGAFVFNRNPDAGELILRVASYQLP